MTSSLPPYARVLLDTNILIRLLSQETPEHFAAQRAVATLQGKQAVLHTTLQNVSEFWNSTTRPRVNNGLGLPPEAALERLRRIESQVVVLADTLSVYRIWRQLIEQHTIIGKQVHDAKLVASMRTHDVPHILTFNGRDFRRYSDIVVLDPLEFPA